ncbi:MAG: hypothetical protein DMG24_19910, partial [Acidobacteria bacterium]
MCSVKNFFLRNFNNLDRQSLRIRINSPCPLVVPYVATAPTHSIFPLKPFRWPFSLLPLFYLERNPPMQGQGSDNRTTALAQTNSR